MLPELRLFVVCWNSTPGTSPHDFRLRDVRTLLFPKPGESFPLVYHGVCFYALMTGVRGAYEFVVRQRHGVGPDGYISWEGLPGRINLGSDPVTVHALPIVEKAVPFRQPGQYEFILLCDGVELSPPFYLEVRG